MQSAMLVDSVIENTVKSKKDRKNSKNDAAEQMKIGVAFEEKLSHKLVAKGFPIAISNMNPPNKEYAVREIRDYKYLTELRDSLYKFPKSFRSNFIGYLPDAEDEDLKDENGNFIKSKILEYLNDNGIEIIAGNHRRQACAEILKFNLPDVSKQLWKTWKVDIYYKCDLELLYSLGFQQNNIQTVFQEVEFDEKILGIRKLFEKYCSDNNINLNTLDELTDTHKSTWKNLAMVVFFSSKNKSTCDPVLQVAQVKQEVWDIYATLIDKFRKGLIPSTEEDLKLFHENKPMPKQLHLPQEVFRSLQGLDDNDRIDLITRVLDYDISLKGLKETVSNIKIKNKIKLIKLK